MQSSAHKHKPADTPLHINQYYLMATNFQGAQLLKIGIHKKFAKRNFTDGESQIKWETVDIVLRKAKHDKDFDVHSIVSGYNLWDFQVLSLPTPRFLHLRIVWPFPFENTTIGNGLTCCMEFVRYVL